MKPWRIGLIAGACLALAAVTMLRSGPDPNAVPNPDEVASRMMSPFCAGLTLEECPSDSSVVLRRQIAEMISKGATNSELDKWMAKNYGVVALGRPRPKLAWLVPPALGAAGFVLVLLILRKQRHGRAGDPAPPELSDEQEARFARDFSGFVRGTE